MNSQKKNQLRERIRTLEGLTADERSALLGLLAETKPYGLVWEEKPEDVEERLRDELPILREVPERAIISTDPDAPNHILIEGDNLEALSTLAYTHEGRIDVIYIDPPYNTGNKDFVYNDSFVDREDAFRHSKWLSFMAKRLRIAKKLLSERGVIFISIDDNEQAQLKLLCDEVFGEESYLGLITRRQSSGAKNDTGENRIITTADYVVSYGKTDFSFVPFLVKNNKVYTRKDKEGAFSPRALEMQGGGDTLAARPRMGYSVYYREADNAIKLLFDYDLNNNPVYKEPDLVLLMQGYVCYRPRKRDMALGRWRWGDGTFMEKFHNNLVHFEKDRVFIKERAKDDIPKYPEAIWDDFLNTQGTNEVKELFGGKSFSFPKPLGLISQLVKVSGGSTILDFFAGSGTTLHAVMQLNAEDGGNRQCILVTNNENGICENVTYERNKRVIQGYTTPKGEAREGLHKNTLRYYKTDFIPRSRSVRNMRQLVRLATDMLCIKENIYTEMAEFGGQKTVPVAYRAFREGDRQMLVVYREEAVEDLAEMIYGMEVREPIIVYVFSPSEDAWSEQWEDVQDKVRPTALPAAIYNTYKRILPKKRDTPLAPEGDALDGDDETQNMQTTLFNEEDMA